MIASRRLRTKSGGGEPVVEGTEGSRGGGSRWCSWAKGRGAGLGAGAGREVRGAEPVAQDADERARRDERVRAAACSAAGAGGDRCGGDQRGAASVRWHVIWRCWSRLSGIG